MSRLGQQEVGHEGVVTGRLQEALPESEASAANVFCSESKATAKHSV